MSFEADRGHIKCNNRETATKVREILAECNRVSAIKMKAWFPWESATSLVKVVRRDTNHAGVLKDCFIFITP